MGLFALASRIFVYVYDNSQNIMAHFAQRGIWPAGPQFQTLAGAGSFEQKSKRPANIAPGRDIFRVLGYCWYTLRYRNACRMAHRLVRWLSLTHVTAPSHTTSPLPGCLFTMSSGLSSFSGLLPRLPRLVPSSLHSL